MRNEQQREKRQESRDKREVIMNRVGDSTHGIEASQDHDDKEKREERRENMAASRTQRFGPGMAVWHRKGLAPRREEGREQRKEKDEKRAESREKIS